MCLPLAVLALIATSAQAVSQHNLQKDAANKMSDAIKQNRESARMDAERAQQQAAEVSAAEANEHSRAAYKDLAAFDAIAGESGGGGSMERGSVSLAVQQGENMATIMANSRRIQTEIGMGDIAAGNRAQQQMASIQRPSVLGTGLTIASAGLGYAQARNKERNGTAKMA